MNEHSFCKRDETKVPVQPASASATFDRPTRSPAVAIRETGEAIVIEADLPGVKAEELQLSINQGVLTVHALVTTRDRDGYRILHREYDDVAFRRAFTLPEGVDGGAISASAKHGVVTIALPKSKIAPPRRIPVTVS